MGISGLIKASRCLIEPPELDRKDFLGIMDELAKLGELEYRSLVQKSPGLLDFFYEATPVEAIALLNIGSRPSHRKKADRSITSIRAIPWIFGWAQSRHTLPAWYGLGTAISNWLDDGNDIETLQQKTRQVFNQQDFAPLSDPDAQLYSGGFFSNDDYQRMQRIQRSTPEQLSSLDQGYDDARIPEMLFRYRARNWPETLNGEERQRWQAFRHARLTEPGAGASIVLDDYRRQLSRLAVDLSLSPAQRGVVDALLDWPTELGL